MLYSEHVIELVAKAAVAYKKKLNKNMKVDVSERYVSTNVLRPHFDYNIYVEPAIYKLLECSLNYSFSDI